MKSQFWRDLALHWVLVFSFFLCFNARAAEPSQTTSTTDNLVIGGNWRDVLSGNFSAGGNSGGQIPAFNPTTGTLLFGYTNKTAIQSLITDNLIKQNTGIVIAGYSYRWEYFNSNMNRGSLTGAISIFNSSGNLLTQRTVNMDNDTLDRWKTVLGEVNFGAGLATTTTGSIFLSFTGKDNRNWAGYYGPMVRNIDFKLTYRPDPCVLNPLYSINCSEYFNVITSENITKTNYAINEALKLSGSGVKVHGLNYGFTAEFGSKMCTNWNLFGICLGQQIQPTFTAAVNVTSSSGETLYSAEHTDAGNDTKFNFNYRHVFNQSQNLQSLNNFSLTFSKSENIKIVDVYSNWIYTPDPCVINPLSSTTCEGHAEAYFNQQCLINPFYNQNCAGYAEAYKNQQCLVNPLYDPGCQGYAQAYLDQQCKINSLFDPTCPGYAQAYFTQQCTINPLSNSECPGYKLAHFNQQCTLNALYNPECPGYTEAFFNAKCISNALYSTKCPEYQQAYFNQQCTLNALYSPECPGYQQAYFNQQCTLNALYSPECPGYAQAFKTKLIDDSCKSNPQSNPLCKQSLTSTASTISPELSTIASISDSANGIKQSQIVSDPVANQLVSTDVANNPGITPPGQILGSGITVPGFNTFSPTGFANNRSMSLTNNSNNSSNSISSSRQRQQAARQIALRAAANAENQVLSEEEKKQEEMMSAMSNVPGFDAYTSARIPDAAFYAPKDIYRNVNIPDNRRAQRALNDRSDRIHKEIVDSQYNLERLRGGSQ